MTRSIALRRALSLSAVAYAAESPSSKLHDAREVHLTNVRQLTFGGENAEAYWAPNGREVTFQSTRPPYACDQILRMPTDRVAEPTLVSTGKGRTTCAYLSFPKADRLYYSSTHGAGEACPPTPDRSHGYVWPLYSSYEIYAANSDGSDPKALTQNSFYDAETTVCPVDGTLLFTSSRDGDLELYSMKPDGTDVQRLTHAPGYDGGAFFSNDCKQIVWRASRPQEGVELDDFKKLLSQDLVRPSKLEIYVANADGTNARQITYLDAASFAPSFYPDGKRVLFSSNAGDPKGREFDIWAVNTDGTELERITYAAGFDGFPLFSPDGKQLVFGSNRNQGKPGETDVYVADWVAGSPQATPGAAERFRADATWLAEDARDGRGAGTAGLEAAGAWLEKRFRDLGLEPAGEAAGFRQPLSIPVAVERQPATALEVDGVVLAAEAFTPLAFSASTSAAGDVVAAGFGIVAPDLQHDDYAGLDVRGKVVAVRRFVPDGEAFATEEAQRRHGDLRAKAFTARERGALALIAVDAPLPATHAQAAPAASADPTNPHAAPAGGGAAGAKPPEEAELPRLSIETGGDAGIPVVVLKRSAGEPLFQGVHRASVTVDLRRVDAPAFNVVGRLRAGAPQPLPGLLVLGAHYDHLGRGGRNSLDPDSHEVHNGADDNASGVAAVLEAARELVARRAELRRDVLFIAFSGEESGVLGSSHWVRHPTSQVKTEDIVAMLNFDMVGRLRDNQVSVLGGESALEWKDWVSAACARQRLRCTVSGDGYGPSDHSPFYAAGVPVAHFFTGVHSDYHKPSDDVGALHSIGGAKVAGLAADVILDVGGRETRPTYRAVPSPLPRGDVRASGASLGTVPDYAGDGRPGVLLAGVRAGGPADKAGIRRGDLLVELANKSIRGVEDLMFVLRSAKAGEEALAAVVRDGKRIELLVTFGPPARMR